MVNLEILCRNVCDIALEVGDFIRTERKIFNSSAIEYKGFNDLVSYVDKTAEKKLVEKLSKLIPDGGFITEENTSNVHGKNFTWVIDPLDGTTNFIHGIPCYCISIGLKETDELIMGVVYEINLDECFYSWKNAAAYLNKEEIHVSKVPSLAQSLIATGFPHTNFSRMKEYMEVFDYLMHHTHGLRRLGSAAVDMAYVACGRFDGFYEYGLNSWDVAAGAFIIQQAGGKVADFSGGKNYLFGKEMVATNELIHNEMLKVVMEKFEKPGQQRF